MNPSNETLNIRPQTRNPLGSELPFGAVARAESANRPDAARVARERIAALTEPRIDPMLRVAPPIITDKGLLATALRGTRPSLPLAAPKLKRPTIPSRLQPLAVAVGVFGLTLLAFKAPIIISQLTYHQNDTAITLPKANLVSAPVSAEPTITIPKINVNAPAEYIDSVQEDNVQAALQNGIVHYGNTALPGTNGNAVYFGHSSNDWWEPGNYKFVFVLLDKLAVGDTFTINYKSVKYTYEVTATKIVDPTAVEVLAQTPTPTATLITCSPPGTSWRRLVISAKQTSPSAVPSTTPVTSTTAANPSTILGNSPSWWDQLKATVSSLFGGKTTTTTTSSSSGQLTLPNVK